MPFLEHGFLKTWPWKSKVKVIDQGHIVDPTSYQLTPLLLHIYWPSHSWDMAYSKFDLENLRLRSRVRSKFQLADPFGGASIMSGASNRDITVFLLCFESISLISPIHYLNQCWLLISEVQWHSPESNFTASVQATILHVESENVTFEINPLRVKFFRANINIHLHFVSFLHIDTTQVVEILPQIRQQPTYSTQ